VSIDAKPLPRAAVQSSPGVSRIPLDPGPHELTVLRNSEPIDSRSFNLIPGPEAHTIELGPYESPVEVPAGKPVALPLAAKPVPIPVAPPPGSRGKLSTVPTSAYVALGFGILGTCLGTVSGILAWHERNGILQNCNGLNCPTRYSTRLDRAKLYGNLSTAAFTAGGVGFATTGLIVVTTPSNPPKLSSIGIELSGRF